ncbi:hypothetical protein Nepgr_027189 [Nepenthes gracilis]|uniref:Uncharacterized protein n=1 Tax=Nepenthes gracilis TaxID=150966 RepID=A0AAD3TA24_NEPGR|nr:hypothetical protein Nepgr_027189 [Nepenthes gracilis]
MPTGFCARFESGRKDAWLMWQFAFMPGSFARYVFCPVWFGDRLGLLTWPKRPWMLVDFYPFAPSHVLIGNGLADVALVVCLVIGCGWRQAETTAVICRYGYFDRGGLCILVPHKKPVWVIFTLVLPVWGDTDVDYMAGMDELCDRLAVCCLANLEFGCLMGLSCFAMPVCSYCCYAKMPSQGIQLGNITFTSKFTTASRCRNNCSCNTQGELNSMHLGRLQDGVHAPRAIAKIMDSIPYAAITGVSLKLRNQPLQYFCYSTSMTSSLGSMHSSDKKDHPGDRKYQPSQKSDKKNPSP